MKRIPKIGWVIALVILQGCVPNSSSEVPSSSAGSAKVATEPGVPANVNTTDVDYSEFHLKEIPVLPEFKTELDRKNYARVAGIYSYSPPDNLFDNFFHFSAAGFSWGSDYDLGKYSHVVDYTGGVWHSRGGGFTASFRIVASDDESVSFLW